MSRTTEQILARLRELEETFRRLEREAGRHVNDQERAGLDRVDRQIEQLRAELGRRGVVAPEGVEIEAQMLPFTDSSFASAFDTSVRNWCTNAQVYLNSAQGAFNSPEPAEGVSVSDVLGCVSLCFSACPAASLFVGTVDTIQSVLRTTYQQVLPAQPSLAEIADGWQTSLANYARADKGPAFQAFIRDYKRREGIPASADRAAPPPPGDSGEPNNSFAEACRTACDQYPGREAVQRTFLTRIVRNVPDRPMDGDDYAGVAECELLELANNFSSPGGEIDDINDALMQALNTVWGANTRVIELPIPINVTLRNPGGSATAEFRRSSNQPNNTDFRLARGEREVFDEFMRQRAYNLIHVGHLSADSGFMGIG